MLNINGVRANSWSAASTCNFLPQCAAQYGLMGLDNFSNRASDGSRAS